MSQTKTMIHNYTMKIWCNKVCFHSYQNILLIPIHDFTNQQVLKFPAFLKKQFSWFLKLMISKLFGFSQKAIIFSNDTPRLISNRSRHVLSIWDNIQPTSRTLTEGLTYPISSQFLSHYLKAWHFLRRGCYLDLSP